MPELPEVETTVKGLNSKVLGRTFLDVWTDAEKIIKKPNNFKAFKKEIKGKKIIKAWRRAKNVIVELSKGYSLLVHQKMTGHLLCGKWQRNGNGWTAPQNSPLADPYNRFLHLIFFLDNSSMLALSDMRKFAKVELWKTKELLNSKDLKKLGPEPLEKDFTFKKFKEVFKNKKGKIKQILMNQEIIAGIGNIYSSEALWLAKIHPGKDTSNLNDKELKLLYNAIKKVLTLGIKLGGESFSDYRKPDGRKGDFDDERKVYKRAGQKCSRCGQKIKRLKIGQRSAFFCPSCQKPQ
ncbi:MAG: DNA-formamidopyrimidine glycosylase [Candidatus Staskawiczbacteria bacterium]|nr:DNA-formamidopyrimidine glycosylase [Candidatus Staskawiczbacteria bacterium]